MVCAADWGLMFSYFLKSCQWGNFELTSNGVKGYCLVLKKASPTDFGGRQSGNWSSQISSTGTSPDDDPMLA